MGGEELTAFLSHLASQRNVAASTQNQALNAILFLYRDVLKIKLPWLEDVQRAKKPQRLPVVLTPQEVRAVLARMELSEAASTQYGQCRLPGKPSVRQSALASTHG